MRSSGDWGHEREQGWDDVVDVGDDDAGVATTMAVEEGYEGIPEAGAVGHGAVEDDDGFAFHEGIFLAAEDEQGEQFLHGAGSAGHDDEGIGVLDHDFHAGVDVGLQPEGGETIGKAFQLDDVRDVRAGGVATGVDAAANDGAHDTGFAGT